MEEDKVGQGRQGSGDTPSHHFRVCRAGSYKAQQLEEKKENGSYQQYSVVGSKNHISYFKHNDID